MLLLKGNILLVWNVGGKVLNNEKRLLQQQEQQQWLTQLTTCILLPEFVPVRWCVRVVRLGWAVRFSWQLDGPACTYDVTAFWKRRA